LGYYKKAFLGGFKRISRGGPLDNKERESGFILGGGE